MLICIKCCMNLVGMLGISVNHPTYSNIKSQELFEDSFMCNIASFRKMSSIWSIQPPGNTVRWMGTRWAHSLLVCRKHEMIFNSKLGSVSARKKLEQKQAWSGATLPVNSLLFTVNEILIWPGCFKTSSITWSGSQSGPREIHLLYHPNCSMERALRRSDMVGWRQPSLGYNYSDLTV